MKRIHRKTAWLAAALLLAASGCAPKGSDTAAKKAEWQQTLRDSIAVMEKQIDSAKGELEESYAKVDELLAGFDRVDDPRQVEGFTMLKGHASGYPLTGTGVTARMLEDQSLEVVAVLKGRRFDRIGLRTPSGESLSETVPADQALNHFFDNLNTVAFTGPLTDTLAMAAAASQSEPLTLVYYSGGSKVGETRLSDSQKQVLASTSELIQTYRRTVDLERSLPQLHKKLQALQHAADRAK